MKRIAAYASILLVAVTLWGCPYKSKVALTDAVEKVDTNLLGKWIPENMLEKESPEYYVLNKRDSLHYDVEHYQYDDENKEYNLKQYVGHTTRLDAILFMNLQESGSKEFLLYRLDVLPGMSMTMYEVTDNIDEQFTDPKQMREFFKKYMNLSFFYNKDSVKLIRMKE
ncbi:MAG: hypothetical protein GC178_04360 [Flavobacteriales bacterium]|nr:hypothetical protein [Flavobacteriales bacterium]